MISSNFTRVSAQMVPQRATSTWAPYVLVSTERFLGSAATLRRVYYANSRAEASQIGFDDGFIYGEVARVPELRKIPHFRLMTDDAQVAFKEWAASLEKIRY